MKNSTFYQSIVEEGRVEEAREILLRLGRRRFGEPAVTTVETLQAEISLERLNVLVDRLLAVESWDELMKG